MQIDTSQLTVEERQELINRLRDEGMRPDVEPMRELQDSRSAHIADLQQFVGLQAQYLQSMMTAMMQPKAMPVPEPKPKD